MTSACTAPPCAWASLLGARVTNLSVDLVGERRHERDVRQSR
jgi:hypothetical protein